MVGVAACAHGRLGAGSFVFFLCSCVPPTPPSDTELYLIVLEAARSELGIPAEISLHPLLAIWSRTDIEVNASLSEFNAFDTVSVRTIVQARPASYRLCRLSVSGACLIGPDEVAVVLSELRDIGTNGIAVRFMITDSRPARDFQQHYVARMKAGLRGWSVVELHRVSASPRSSGRVLASGKAEVTWGPVRIKEVRADGAALLKETEVTDRIAIGVLEQAKSSL